MQCNEVIRELAAPSDGRDSDALAEHLASCAKCSEWAKRTSQLDRLWKATRAADPTPQVWETVWAKIALSLDPSTPIRVEHPAAHAASRNGTTPKVALTAVERSSLSRPSPWSFRSVALFGLAQAAAVLLVVSLAWQSFPLSQNAQIARSHLPVLSDLISPSVDAASLSIEIEEGSLVVIRSKGEKLDVSVLTSENSPFGIGRLTDGNTPGTEVTTRIGNPAYGEFASSGRLDGWLLMFNIAESMASNPVVVMKE